MRIAIAWAALAGLVLFIAIGHLRMRHARDVQYASFLLVGAIGFAALPAIFGDWLWSAGFFCAGLVEVYFRMRTRRRRTADYETASLK